MVNLLLLLAGFAILIKGADFLVVGASSIAKKCGISNLAIGLTVVAFGTSMPEFIVSLLAAINGQNDASFGNVIGSNNFNLLFILGLAGIIYPLVVQKSTVKYEIPISLIAAGVLFLLVNDELIRNGTGNSLGRVDSGVLMLCFALFMGYIYKTMKNSSGEEVATNTKVYRMSIAIVMVVVGLVMLIGGGKLVVDSAISIAHHFGLSEKLIGLTILAAGTSLPELATSAVAAYKRNTDIAIGNVIGSNIFNIFFILGLTGLITPIHFNTAMNFDIYVLLGSTIVLMIFMFTINRAKLDRWEAIILLGAYLVYTAVLISMD
ncbi:MAG: calcium/sodium antiporter [Flammeovirgaceae bacterium]|nr:MAG: calcium/sodium antiporter [Flammeovirgaceae bacterium]